MQGKSLQNVVIKTADVFDRLKRVLELETDAELARALGEPPKKLGVWRLRDTVPYELLISFCSQNRLRLEWALTGEGAAREDRRAIIAEPQEKFDTAQQVKVDGWFSKGDQVTLIEFKKPTLDQATSLLRMVIEEYGHLRPESSNKSRDIALIFRHFVDNYSPTYDEVEIDEYIEEWF